MSRSIYRIFALVQILFCGAITVLALSASSKEAPIPQYKKNIKIVFVGDIIFQNRLHRVALSEKRSYISFWSGFIRILAHTDAVYGNLEGTLASNITFDQRLVSYPGRSYYNDVYRHPPGIFNFNYHYSLARDLRRSGFMVLSTANNHALDRGVSGVDQTIERLTDQGLVAVGTKHSGSTSRPWGHVTLIRNMKIGWVACTFGTNGAPDILTSVAQDRPGQVRPTQGGEVEGVLPQEAEQRRAQHRSPARAHRPVARAIGGPYRAIDELEPQRAGIEDHEVITRRQEALAREAANAGATMIVGTHPHIIQKAELVISSDGREVPVFYSTGNFISGQKLAHQRVGLVVTVELAIGAASRKARLASMGYAITCTRSAPPKVLFVKSVHRLNEHDLVQNLNQLDLSNFPARCNSRP